MTTTCEQQAVDTAKAVALTIQLSEENKRLQKRVAELEAAQPKWIAVEERLPEPPSNVLVWVVDTGAGWLDQAVIARFGGKHSEDFYSSDRGILDDGGIITHWQPLPEPPQPPAAAAGEE